MFNKYSMEKKVIIIFMALAINDILLRFLINKKNIKVDTEKT